MMPPDQAVLIAGADGMIGSSLVRRFREAGWTVVETTRRSDSCGDMRVMLDLDDDPSSWRPPAPVGLVIIAAAICSTERCRLDPIATSRVNVRNTVALARASAEQGAFVILISTNMVFDGSRPARKTSDPVEPQSEYGRQKAEVERRLLELGERVAVIRLTKVLGDRPRLITGWVAALNSGRPIQPFSDMVMSPIPVQFAAEAILNIGLNQVPGISHASGDRDITYADAATHIAAALGADRSLVQPMSALGAGLPIDCLPKHTTLDMSRLTKICGLRPPCVWDVIDRAIR
ncbi:MAG: sugar nucleotide-binding protein [Acidobacteria bacterium]|nr:sugar nucleotide-binding protein [Acidobacteriota bacterium]